MKTIDVRAGRERPMRIPVETGFAALDELTMKLEQQRVELAADTDRERALVAELDQVRAAKTDALAEALIAGEAKPKEPAKIAALEKRLQELRETIEGRVQACRRLETTMHDLIGENALAWVHALDQEISSELDAWADDLAVLEERGRVLVDAFGRRNWAASAARGESKAKAGQLIVHELLGPNQAPYVLNIVLAALRTVGQPVEPKTLPTMPKRQPAQTVGTVIDGAILVVPEGDAA